MIRSKPAVQIIIPCFNNLPDTLECLGSLATLEYPNAGITLVDNGSSDSTAEVVAERFPSVVVIRLSENRGVPAGFNVGIRQALRTGADYVFLLNNDTTVDPEALGALVIAAECNPSVAMLMPKVLYHDRPSVIWSAGARYRRFPPAIVFEGRGRPASAFSQARLIDYAPACALLFPRQTFERVGLFDSGYFFFFEDWDFCERIRQAGMGILFVPQARIWHKVSRTVRRRPELLWRTWGASCVRFYRRHGRPVWVSLPVHCGYILAREVVHGNGWWLRSFLDGGLQELRKPLGPVPSLDEDEVSYG